MSIQAYAPTPKSVVSKSIHPRSMASARLISNNRTSSSTYESYVTVAKQYHD